MDDSAPRAPLRLALKAAQASLFEGLTCLWVATTARSPALLAGEGVLCSGCWVFARGNGGGHGGRPVQFDFPGGLGSSDPPCPILPSASTGDSFTVIPGLEGQVTSPLLSAQGKAYDGRYGIF